MSDIYDLIILGGGPAAITAGIYSARQNNKTLLITKTFGGQIAKKPVDIENYTGFEEVTGPELIQKFESHLRRQNITIELDEAKELKKDEDLFSVYTKSGKEFKSKAVIAATGAEPRQLGIPGEKEFIGKGVSYCVTCDGPFFKNKTIAVIGGGNAGFEVAIFMAEIAKKVYIMESGFSARADAILQDRAQKNGKIELITGVLLKKIVGEKFLKSLIYDAAGQTSVLELEGIFVEIGSQPAVSFINGLADFNEKKEVVVDERNQTKTPGLFAAGDVTDCFYKQIIIAAGDGAKAALSVRDYFKSKEK